MNNKIYQFQMEKIIIPKFIENKGFFVGIEKTSSNEPLSPFNFFHWVVMLEERISICEHN